MSSTSSDDDGDADWNAKGLKISSGGPKRRSKRQKVDTNNSDASSNEDEEHEQDFDDGYDENLMGDEEDQNRLAQMTEKEREQELFNRSEKREMLRTRFQIERKLAKKKAAATTKNNRRQRVRTADIYSDSDDASPPNTRDSSPNRVSEEPVSVAKRAPSSSSSSSSSPSSSSPSSSDDDSDDRPLKSSANFADSDSDDDSDRQRGNAMSSSENEEDEAEEELTLADMRSIQLKRTHIEQWCYAPFFRQTAIGLLVRISVSNDPISKAHIYRTGQVMDVVEMAKIYNIGNSVRTNKGLLLRIGPIERTYQMLYVSNTPFEQKDLIKYKEQTQHDTAHSPLKRSHFTTKALDLHKALRHEWTDKDIETMVSEKMRFKDVPYNFAVRKTKLLNEKAEAEIAGDYDTAYRLQTQIDEVERKANEAAKQRSSSTFSAITAVNDRNRKINIEESEKAIMLMKNDIKTEDPFTRRKCTPTVVSKFTKSSAASTPTGTIITTSSTITTSASTTTANSNTTSGDTRLSPDLGAGEESLSSSTAGLEDGGTIVGNNSNNNQHGIASVNDRPVAADDLFAAHTGIHLDIDLEILE